MLNAPLTGAAPKGNRMNRRQNARTRRNLPGLESDPRPRRQERRQERPDPRSDDLLARMLPEAGHLFLPFR